MLTRSEAAKASKARQELLWAVLRLGQPIGLDLQDLLRCQATCSALRELAWEHVTLLEYTGADAAQQAWWRPALLHNVVTASCVLTQIGLLRQLHSLTLCTSSALESCPESVSLQPLSSLLRLEQLSVASAATDLAALPLLTSLEVSPTTPEDYLAIGLQMRLTSLVLDGLIACYSHMEGSRQPEDFVGLLKLQQLHSLSFSVAHVGLLVAAGDVSACSSLRCLHLWYIDGCECISPDISSLTKFTQLTALKLSGFDDDSVPQLSELPLDRLPGLRNVSRIIALAD